MNADTARSEVFGDALACEESRPAGFRVASLEAPALAATCARAEGLLRALALVEDSRSTEETEDYDPAAQALGRLEAKVDLLTALVARLAQGNGPADPVRMLRWSALGVCLQGEETAAPGSRGVFRIQPSDWLPEALELPATVLASVTDGDGPQLWLRFGPLPPALESALERHLFRVHRRAIAEARRPR